LASVLGLGGRAAAAPGVPANGDFSQGLAGWLAGESGGGQAPGSVTLAPGGDGVVLAEGDSFLVTLEQTFVVPAGLQAVVFDLDAATPGFDTTDAFVPDAFEVALVDAAGQPVVPVWTVGAVTFYNLPETGGASLAPGVSVDGGTVLVDVSAVPAGTSVTLRFALLGADGDTGSGVTLSNVRTYGPNEPPVADAGADQTLECTSPQGASATLDGSASADPDGDPLTFVWADEQGAPVGDQATTSVDVPMGSHPFTVTVDDQQGGTDQATTTVTVVDTTPPVVGPLEPVQIVADAACAGVLPDLTSPGEGLPVTEACTASDQLSVTQDPPAGTPLALGAQGEASTVTVTITVTDGAGLEGSAQTTVTLVDSDPSCAVVDPGPEPAVEPEPEPVVDPGPEPAAEPEPEPVVDPGPEPAVEQEPEPVLDPGPEPAAEQEPEPVLDPGPEPAAEQEPEPVLDPGPEPAAEQEPEPVLDPGPEPAAEPMPELEPEPEPEPEPAVELAPDAGPEPEPAVELAPDAGPEPPPVEPGPADVGADTGGPSSPGGCNCEAARGPAGAAPWSAELALWGALLGLWFARRRR